MLRSVDARSGSPASSRADGTSTSRSTRGLTPGRWLEVTGTLQQGRGLQWLEAQAGSLKLAKPPAETTSAHEPDPVPAAPPPEVVFSAPTQDETDVSWLSASVRIQFSRDIDPATPQRRPASGDTRIR